MNKRTVHLKFQPTSNVVVCGKTVETIKSKDEVWTTDIKKVNCKHCKNL